jgi:hypothetical protein
MSDIRTCELRETVYDGKIMFDNIAWKNVQVCGVKFLLNSEQQNGGSLKCIFRFRIGN